LVQFAAEFYELNPEYNIQFDYWSNVIQSYVMHGTLDPDPESVHLVAVAELGKNQDGKSCLVIRLKNCTGNIIDLSYSTKSASKKEVAKGEIIRSVDFIFKNQRSHHRSSHRHGDPTAHD